MTYQGLARKYRPQRFQDIVGQRGVTQTLRNAIATERVAQAFVFAGPRGVGKTTTARILARALNCERGPTADPCGTCDACVEIAEGRDIDVLEIDAATHTQVENVREVIIAGLATAPVRTRYKVFIIDEFHQLSSHSFNALLKSLEEPPPHVVFMMATTELQKIPDTILSRSQVFEFRTIGTQMIAAQLKTIAKAEKITVDDASIALIARNADGSMRDAQSAFDQVIAFAGDQITAEEVSTVLGLIGRDPVLDVVEVVANEDPTAVFELAGRFVEAGYDLRLVCRELTRAVRDLMVISIDATRAQDPEIAGDAERDRLVAVAARFSREDLLRAFDLLARAEFEIRGAAQPRHHFEMALLKWIHLRKLVPLTDLLEGSEGEGRRTGPAQRTASRPSPVRRPSAKPDGVSASQAPEPSPPSQLSQSAHPPQPSRATDPDENEKAAILAEIKRAKKFFYGTVVAQAQHIDLVGDRLVFAYTPAQRTLASQVQQNRRWLETLATKVIGRAVAVGTTQEDATSTAPAEAPAPASDTGPQELRARAMKDQVVKAMLDVFPAEIGEVEQID